MDIVYWVRDDSCIDIEKDGYVGVTYNPKVRLRSHITHNERVPKGVRLEVVYEGPRDKCFDLEEKLRPEKNIGWNRAIGGAHGYLK